MEKFKPINGWTKDKILAVIEARKFDETAMESGRGCAYLTKDGNKCAVGLFIPDGHLAQACFMNVTALLKAFPDLIEKMPLSLSALSILQDVHDDERDDSALYPRKYDGNAKAAMLTWVKENVE